MRGKRFLKDTSGAPTHDKAVVTQHAKHFPHGGFKCLGHHRDLPVKHIGHVDRAHRSTVERAQVTDRAMVQANARWQIG